MLSSRNFYDLCAANSEVQNISRTSQSLGQERDLNLKKTNLVSRAKVTEGLNLVVLLSDLIGQRFLR